MKLFISYSSARREVCERLRLALEAEGHQVFADRADLRAGEGYHETLREAIQAADCFVFLISPESVAPGSYTLAELSIAEQRWRVPAGHVLPVVIAPTEMASIPPYLRAVTLLQPQGEVVAETVAALARMKPPRRWGVVATVLAATVALCVAGYVFLQQREAQHEARAAQQREQARVEQAVASALQLCEAGDHALGWQQLATLAASPAAATAREQCGMRWLRAAQVTVGKETFSALADRIKPLLAEGLSASTGQHAADLRAHLGWADFLRSRDGLAGIDPVPQYRRAIQDDANNGYAQAMWGHWLLWQSPRHLDEAQSHFDSALKDSRDRAFVRGLQLAALSDRPTLRPHLLPVLDAMRHSGDMPAADLRARLFRGVFVSDLIDPGTRAALLAALPPPALLATFDWLDPRLQRGDGEQRQIDFCRALLQANAGAKAAARAGFEALRQALIKQQATGRIVDETEKQLKALAVPASPRR